MAAANVRLLTGIFATGTLVLTAGTLLWTNATDKLTVGPASESGEVVQLLVFVAFWVILLLPFDVFAGFFRPGWFGRRRSGHQTAGASWCRAVMMQTVGCATVLWLSLSAGRVGGIPAVLLCFVLMQIVLLAAQKRLWTFVSGQSVRPADDACLIETDHANDRFTGGVVGLPGWTQILMPSGWRQHLGERLFDLAVRRRTLIVDTGARNRGVFLAIVWNTLMLAAACGFAGGSPNSVADIMETWLWFLLLSFFGLLILPRVSRAAVRAADGLFVREHGREALRALVHRIDELTEQDDGRSPSQESVFQPIPCPSRRLNEAAEQSSADYPAWNVARTVLYLSWAFGGPLARAVHCNVGQPELWVMPPAD